MNLTKAKFLTGNISCVFSLDVFCLSWEKVKYVNFIRAFGEPKKHAIVYLKEPPFFFFWIGVIWLKTRIPPWFFRKFHPLFFVAEDYCCPPEAFCSSKKSHPFFLPISHIIPSGGWLIHFGGGGDFFGANHEFESLLHISHPGLATLRHGCLFPQALQPASTVQQGGTWNFVPCQNIYGWGLHQLPF